MLWNETYAVGGIHDLETFHRKQAKTISSLLEELCVHGVPMENLEISLTRGIESWEEARVGLDEGLYKPVSDFIEFLYKMFAYSKKVVISALERKIAKFDFDEEEN